MPQERVVLRNCGKVDPRDVGSYLALGGFAGLHRALAMGAEQVIEEVKKSGLRGRGGAGFPTGLKWQFTRAAGGTQKYVIGNADEGEMGTFKDRFILESDPFSLVEGMAIAGYAVGASKGYIYLRAEYARLLELVQGAINQVKAKGLLRSDSFSFDLAVRLGAGAYVCGEETALMESIEGKRGEARFRPPFPPSSGLWKMPTVINNVETLTNIPAILACGADWFSRMGTEKSKGTKVFSVSGDVERPGVYELVMGSTVRELVVDLAGAKDVGFVQVGGASGRLVRREELDRPLAFESVLGAGAVIVYDSGRDVVQMVLRTMEFFDEESCGKCTPCREGTKVIVDLLGGISRGEGRPGDLAILREVAEAMATGSLCGLGQAAPNTLLDSLDYFPEAYQAGMRRKAAGDKVGEVS